jgi:hypothetical protein
MDAAAIRKHIQRHADAVVHGLWTTVAADFAEGIRLQVPQIIEGLPRPSVTSAEVLSLEIGQPDSVAMIRYSGESGDVTLRSRWQDRGGEHPVIVQIEPVDRDRQSASV